MKNNNIEKNHNIPGLRFPEFKNDGEWNLEPFGDVYSFKVTNSFSRENLNYVEGFVKNIHYGDIHTKFSALFDIAKEIVPYINHSLSIDKIRLECYCIEGDMIFADASEDLNDIGKSIEICKLNDEKLVSGLHTLLARQKRPKFIVGFGGHLFLSNGIRTQIQREAQGSKVLSISTGRLSNIRIYYPENKKEQQKIASCLSSLDELIAVENQKLEALKSHKKGLMQQLFPTEGETLPKLRFAEFRDSGEWEKKTLVQCLIQHPEYGINAPAVPYSDNLPTYLRITDISEDGYFLRNQMVSVDREVTKDNYLNEGDIVLARTGASVGKSYKYRIEDGRLVFAGFLIRVKPNVKKINPELLFQFLNTDKYWRWVEYISARSGQPGINGNEYASMSLLLPSSLHEQQKIASCLSSLDELIAAKSQKIEALKVHKKGLMQGLFPNINNISV